MRDNLHFRTVDSHRMIRYSIRGQARNFMIFQNLFQSINCLDVCNIFSLQLDAVFGFTLNCIDGIFLVRKILLIIVLYTS